MKTATASTLLLLVVAGSAGAQERREIPPFETHGEPASIEDAEAVEGVMREFRAAWRAQDAERLAALHSPDVEWINAYARIFRGSESLRSFLGERLFPDFDPDVSREEARNMKPISIRYLGDDAAVVHWYTDSPRGASRVAGEELRRTHLHFVLAKREGAWKIVHEVIFDAR